MSLANEREIPQVVMADQATTTRPNGLVAAMGGDLDSQRLQY